MICRKSIFLAALLSASSPTYAQSNGGDFAAVLSVDRTIAQASVARDVKKLKADLDERLIWIDRTGTIRSKAQIVADIPESGSNDQDTDVQGRRYGSLAIVTGTHRIASQNLDTRFLHVYVERAGRWKAIAFEETTVQTPETQPKTVSQPIPAPKATPGATCDNPCANIPYRPTNQAGRDILATYEKLETASTFGDIDKYAATFADEITIVGPNFSGTAVTKAAAIASHRRMKDAGVYYPPTPITQMKLFVSGEAAVMESLHVSPAPPPKPTVGLQIWVKRQGRWLLAMSQQTRVQERSGAAK